MPQRCLSGLCLIGLCMLLLTICHPASAIDFSLPWFGAAHFYGNEYFYYGNNSFDEPYTEIKNRLNLNLETSNLLFGMQLRTQKYSDADAVSLSDLKDQYDVHLEKRFLEYHQDYFSARAGDSYVSLGRGLTLNIQKNEALDIDDTLDGGLFRFNTAPFEATLIGGTIKRGLPIFDPGLTDRVYAGRTQMNLPLRFKVGATYLWSEVHEMDERINDYQCFGGDFSYATPHDEVEFYGEYAKLDSSLSDVQPDYMRVPDGSGLYASATGKLAGWVLLLEYKNYNHFDFPKNNPQYTYNLPPSADRLDDPNSHDDVKGIRSELSYFLKSFPTLFHISYGSFDDHANVTEFTHTYGGFEIDYDWFYIHAIYGTRHQTESLSGTVETNEDRVSLDSQIKLTDTQSLNWVVETKRTVEDFTFGHDLPPYRQTINLNRTYLTYALSPYFSLTAHYSWDYLKDNKTTDLWAGEIEFTPITAWSLKLLYGSQPGGLVCSGGLCRTVPDFEGVKIETTIRW